MGWSSGWPYRMARDGVWGAQTSTLNWCEEDYNITPYIAECINTFTNLVFLYLGYRAVTDCIRNQYGKTYVAVCVGYLTVGLGSMAFHTTLKYELQLADELPMIYTTCIMMFATFSSKRHPMFSIILGLGIFGLAGFITVFYLTSKDPVFHQTAFALITASTIFRAMYGMEFHLRPALRARAPTPRADALMRKMWALAGTGIGFFLLGFALWNLDNIYCDRLRSIRSALQLPLAILLEGHAWWHVLTGLGAYYFIQWRVWLTCCLDGKEDIFRLEWPSIWTSVPRTVAREKNAGRTDRAPHGDMVLVNGHDKKAS